MSTHLLIASLKKKLYNLFYAGLGFLLILVGQLGYFFFYVNDIINRIFMGISMILVVIFTNETFHKEQRSMVLQQDRESYLPFTFLLVSIINFIIMIFLSFLIVVNNSLLIHYIRVSHNFFSVFVVFLWLSGSSYQAYSELKNQDIEPWIKVRYKLITIISLIAPLHQLILFFQPWDENFGTFNSIESYIVFGLVAIFSAITSLGFLIAWIMPKRFKQFLGKNYKSVIDKNFSQEELTEIIKFLAEKLAEKIELSPTAARGLIKLAIQEHVGVFKPFSQVNFKSFKEIIQGTLKQRLIKLEFQNIEDVIDIILNYLVKSQSLITMGSV